MINQSVEDAVGQRGIAYLFVPPRDFLERAISSADLAVWWQGIDAGEMIMIVDPGYAGAVSGRDFRPAPLGDPGFGQLSYDKHMPVSCAAQPAQTGRGQWIGGGKDSSIGLSDAIADGLFV
jgi:hypothetical protein